MKKLFLPLWIIGAVALFLYSYTQVDLSLTLSRASIFQDIQRSFQYIGWFDRPLSSVIYIAIFIYLFALYIFSLKLIATGMVDKKAIWKTILFVTAILTLSYNALSYDIFNYIFDAKIITFYNQNPYLHKALDFPGDPMLSFMHWTHRTYPYGPVWLLVTVPLSYAGSQIFIVTFFLFKILISSFFLLTAYSIGKISEKLKYKNALLPVAFFALNPYVILESLVSSHNDIVMMGFMMFGVFYLYSKSYIKGWILILLSIGTKFATLLPAVIFVALKIFRKDKHFIFLSAMVMIIAVIAASLRTTYQPWYFLYIVPFASLLTNKKYIIFPTVVWSIVNLVYYLPYLYFGNWNQPVSMILNYIIISGLVIAALSSIISLKFKK